MARIVAIDFETANSSPNSACQLGVVVLNDKLEVQEERSWLIRPPSMYFSPFCVRVHGITPRQCMNAPVWSEIWNDVYSVIEGGTLIGHNVGFDAKVLMATCQHYDLFLGATELQCSRLIAKRTWPQLDGHGLANVAKHLQLEFKHHDALEDARASGRVAAASLERFNLNSFEALEEHLGLIRGDVRFDRLQNPRTVRIKREQQESSFEGSPRASAKVYQANGVPKTQVQVSKRSKAMARAIVEQAKSFQPLAGKNLVLVDSLLGLDRPTSVEFLEDLGATVAPRINLKTQVVVLGISSYKPALQQNLFVSEGLDDLGDQDASCADKVSEEINKRRELGQSIYTLSQRQLLALIPGASEIVRGE